MPVDKQKDSKTYKVTPAIRKTVLEATIKRTLEQIAHSELMMEYYQEMADNEPEKEKSAKLLQQKDQLEAGLKLNRGLIEWANK